MAIAKTNLHRKHLIYEAETGVLNLQNGVIRNAMTHKQWAIDATHTLPKLQEIITDTIASYEWIRSRLRTFRDVTLPGDPELLIVGAAIKSDMASVGAVGQEVADHIDVFITMPRTTYAEIIVACDYLIANVNAAPTLWD